MKRLIKKLILKYQIWNLKYMRREMLHNEYSIQSMEVLLDAYTYQINTKEQQLKELR